MLRAELCCLQALLTVSSAVLLGMELEPIHLLPARSLEVLKSLLLEGVWSQSIQFSTARCQQPGSCCRTVSLCQMLFPYRGQLLLI